MQSPQFLLGLADELIADEFACGGGMSEGIEQAIGRHVDIAVNHDADACSMHEANHPQTVHYCKDVKEVCPRVVTGDRAVGLLHLSPDCTHHSQARGGQPRSRVLRALAWRAVRWGGTKRPRIITLENVKQILLWGPLIAKRCPKTKRVVKLDGTVAQPGERVPVDQQHLVPDPKRAGKTWRAFVRALERQGYEVEHRILCAADYGAPTTRSRLFMVARCDGAPIVWPEPTHFKNPKKGQQRWRSAAECIDWSIQGRSIFEREKPLADATLRRVAHGMKRYVLDSADPFIVQIANWSRAGLSSGREPLSTITAMPRGGSHAVVAPVMIQAGHGQGTAAAPRWSHGNTSVRDPVGTVTASGGGQAVAVGSLVQMGYGERDGQAPRALDAQQPLGTVVGAGKFAAVTAFVEQANGGFNETPGHDARAPMSTITSSGKQQRVVTATLISNTTGHAPTDLRQPSPTLTTGQHHALVEYTLSPEAEAGAMRVAAFLIRYYGQGGQLGDLREPMATSTTKDRLALVTVWLRGTPYVIVDIQLRMLNPRELYNANSFPKTYIIDRGHDGRIFSKSTQVRMCGNAVPPLLGKAVIKVNWDSRVPMRRAA
ncbi:DNA cytosine methyltransferase [Paracidovorax wautersii]|uniref:DNA (cytosine-5-)-methyltransferase n=1 Tax=Paracidovorax wautersii TaxID=1177982 RepID=A0A1I2GCN6_9BURK|nr:DNA cytosine methyltransferase [Paracidovorax wautersii]SFF14958.1 DNA (cytosine-5)-methyltransferase 1 [Paracidovorax wautersii]